MSLPEHERMYGREEQVLQVSAGELARIDADAKRFEMSRSEYIIRACALYSQCAS